jgi:hypothetical protein
VNSSTSFNNFQILKDETLQVLGIQGLVPSDCRLISKDILLRTTYQLSETTLKRVYGFANGKFSSSQYTANVLAEYCGYKGWKDFIARQNAAADVHLPVALSDFRSNVDKITNFTMASLRNKSGIPYSYCLQRSFLTEFIDGFLASKRMGAVLYAPAGYGKTIAICKWIDQVIKETFKVAEADTILFFSSQVLMNAMLTGKDMNQWIMSLLGYKVEDNLMLFFADHEDRKSKFYLIIDGLDPHMFSEEQYDLLLTQLSLLQSIYQQFDWFKVIMVMRTSSWFNSKHLFNSDGINIYSGFPITSEHSNVPLLTVSEIKALASNINPSVQHSVDFNLIEYFKYALFYQYFYKENKKDFRLNKVSPLVTYDVVFDFMLNKIYLGSRSEDKVLLIRSLIVEIDFKNHAYHIDKLRVVTIIKTFSMAYYDLISLGFLKEENLSDLNGYGVYISFGSPAFLQYSIARTFLQQNQDLLNETLINKINHLVDDSGLRFEVFKWCILVTLRRRAYESLGAIRHMSFTTVERISLICFLAEALEKEDLKSDNHELLVLINEVLVNYFLGLELISNDYRKALTVLIEFKLTPFNEILVNTTLGIIDVVQLNLDNLEQILKVLSTFNSDQLTVFGIDVFMYLDTIYHYLKFGIVKKPALTNLTTKLFHSTDDTGDIGYSNARNIVQLLELYSALAFNNPKKLIKIASVLQKNLGLSNIKGINYSEFFLKILLADSYFKIGNDTQPNLILEQLSTGFMKNANEVTPIMETLFSILKIKVLLMPRDQVNVIDQVYIIDDSIKQSNANLSKLMILGTMCNQLRFKISFPDHHSKLKTQYEQMTVAYGLGI